ncbi:hypothetical protein PM082_004213 [Marasmius tenuissimus]|nr:hypothetical protein PM082_004213 [Marasmius tenuissimus]
MLWHDNKTDGLSNLHLDFDSPCCWGRTVNSTETQTSTEYNDSFSFNHLLIFLNPVGKMEKKKLRLSINDSIPERVFVSNTLPNEIISLILGFFDISDDAETLEHASLVARCWRGPAQARLFLRIEVENNEECTFWSQKFTDFPHLARYVKQLCFSDEDEEPANGPYLRNTTAKTLVSSLQYVQGLDLLDIRQWGPMEMELMKGLGSTVRSLWVDAIPQMNPVKDLPELLYALHNIEVFKPGDIGSEYKEEELTQIHAMGLEMRSVLPADGKPRRLREIYLCEIGFSLDHLLWLSGPAFDLSGLRNLTFSWSHFSSLETYDFTVLDDFIRLVGGNVTNLTLLLLGAHTRYDPDHWKWPGLRLYDADDLVAEHFINSPILQHFTALETITIAPDEDDDHPIDSSNNDIYTSNVKNILRAMSGRAASQLKKIIFKATSSSFSYRVGFCSHALEKLLSNDEAFPSLRDIEIHLNVFRHPREMRLLTWTKIAQDIQNSLMGAIYKTKVKLVAIDLDEEERLLTSNEGGLLQLEIWQIDVIEMLAGPCEIIQLGD